MGFKAYANLPRRKAGALLKDAFVVMDVSGYSLYCLAQFLDKAGIAVSVVNLLSVKLFIRMKLAKVKTDKSNAKDICEYGRINEVLL
jgi:transposase